MAKGNLIIPRRNSKTGCSLKSYPEQIIIIINTIIFIIDTEQDCSRAFFVRASSFPTLLYLDIYNTNLEVYQYRFSTMLRSPLVALGVIFPTCTFCRKDFISLGRHSWRCKSKLSSENDLFV